MKDNIDKITEIRGVLAYLTLEWMLFSTKKSNFANKSAKVPQNRNIIMRFTVGSPAGTATKNYLIRNRQYKAVAY